LNAVIEYCNPNVECSITGKRLAAVAETFGLMKTPPDETGTESTLMTKEARRVKIFEFGENDGKL